MIKMSIHPCIECDHEVRPRQQALQCDGYGRSYGLSDHMIDFCVVSLHGLVRNQEKVSQAHEMSVSKKRVRNKRTTLHFFVLNGERFPLLLETKHAFRIVTQTYFNSEYMTDFCVVKSSWYW